MTFIICDRYSCGHFCERREWHNWRMSECVAHLANRFHTQTLWNYFWCCHSIHCQLFAQFWDIHITNSWKWSICWSDVSLLDSSIQQPSLIWAVKKWQPHMCMNLLLPMVWMKTTGSVALCASRKGRQTQILLPRCILWEDFSQEKKTNTKDEVERKKKIGNSKVKKTKSNPTKSKTGVKK